MKVHSISQMWRSVYSAIIVSAIVVDEGFHLPKLVCSIVDVRGSNYIILIIE